MSSPSLVVAQLPLLVGEANPYGLLGAKVTRAFGFGFQPFTAWRHYLLGSHTTYVCLPHPSGLCRAWNEPGAYARARGALRGAGLSWSGATE